jgi:hypothetical protein
VSESVFVPVGDGRFVPTERARGPWDPQALHGGAPAALLTSAFERVQPGAELQIARLSFEFLRPVPMAPLKLSTRIVRPGRRVQELVGELSAPSAPAVTPASREAAQTASAGDPGIPAEQVVCRASALRVQAVPTGLPQLPGTDTLATAPDAGGTPPAAVDVHGWAVNGRAMPSPQAAAPLEFSLEGSGGVSFASAMEMRSPGGTLALGPGQVWMRLRGELVRGEQPTALARMAACADFANGISAALPFEEFLFINADLAIHLQREPRGEWIGLDARTLLCPGGSGLSDTVLHDEHGPCGRAFQSLIVQAR